MKLSDQEVTKLEASQGIIFEDDEDDLEMKVKRFMEKNKQWETSWALKEFD